MEEMVICPPEPMLTQTFKGKTIVVTGHTGFKGAWLSLWLSKLGAKVIGLALDPVTEDSIYHQLDKEAVFSADLRCDLLESEKLASILKEHAPDFVFHLAAQPLVRLSYSDPVRTLATNVMGSAHVLEAVRALGKKCHVIFVTSDKCYLNKEQIYAYREIDRLGGRDPYSMSKAAAELVAECWRRSFFDADPTLGRVISVRAGNVIGGGDYSQDRLIPDCVRAVTAGAPIVIRNPIATRPWQHVLDCLHGYLVVAAHADAPPAGDFEAFNFGPQDTAVRPVLEVVNRFRQYWKGESQVQVEQNVGALHEAKWLAVSIEKATRMLPWKPVWDFDRAIYHTAAWYSARHESNQNLHEFSSQQLAEFMRDAAASAAEESIASTKS